ncbi:MAG TPA: hypothetical protein VFL42_00590, partial [Terriglobales bacterium]|nr:hypothetical protein [Terriglobales bacterium]
QANPGGPAAMLLSHFGLMSGLAGTIFASLGPALIGFGVGTHFGPLGGALAGGGVGFGVGALIGLAGGPIGALIGGIVGAIAGLFGGLFGSGKRKRQANAFANNTVLPAVQQIEDQYKNFSLDYTSSISQLEDLRKQAQDQLGKLKGEGRDVMKKVVGPAIDHAEADINGFEAERQRRAALTFGPPEFHSGGLVDTMTRSFTGRPGDLLAVLSRGEFVVNPQATARNRRTLEAINSGGSAALSVGEIHIHPATLDRAYVRSGFKQDLLDALKSLRKEGRL